MRAKSEESDEADGVFSQDEEVDGRGRGRKEVVPFTRNHFALGPYRLATAVDEKFPLLLILSLFQMTLSQCAPFN